MGESLGCHGFQSATRGRGRSAPGFVERQVQRGAGKEKLARKGMRVIIAQGFGGLGLISATDSIVG